MRGIEGINVRDSTRLAGFTIPAAESRDNLLISPPALPRSAGTTDTADHGCGELSKFAKAVLKDRT